MKLDDLKGLYIAHRGIHNDKIVENTLKAFYLAINYGVPIEFDINILKDGNIVVYHDKNLKRLMGVDRKLSSYSYDELKELFFPNSNSYIPLFSDALKQVDGKVLLVIEIKNTEICSYQKYCEKIVSILENYSGNVVIKSFDIRIVYWFLKNTNYITGLLMIKRKKSLYDFIINKGVTLSILKPDFISVDYHIVDSKLVRNFRQTKPVLVWTISNKQILKEVKDKADSFLVDNADFFNSKL